MQLTASARDFLAQRQLLRPQLPPAILAEVDALLPHAQPGRVTLGELTLTAIPAMTASRTTIKCNRCWQVSSKASVLVPAGWYYCPHCLMLGKVTSNTLLYTTSGQLRFAPLATSPLTWTGTLTPVQAHSSAQITQAITKQQPLLVNAATGAGKTEMVLHPLATALMAGLRVAVVAPRVDVIGELAPRLAAAFADIDQLVLHGQTHQPYRRTQLVVATTHQLLRFYQAFDVIIVDEVDAFPYHNNPLLQTAVKRAATPTASLIYLTATPSRLQRQLVAKKRLKQVVVPARFHGRPLPVPQLLVTNHAVLPGSVVRIILRWLEQEWQFLIFVPSLRLARKVYAAITQHLAPKKAGAVIFAADPKRLEKVQDLRDGTLHFAVTTTILERGVTLAGINVLVVRAAHPVFNQATLVQIAGRVGRKLSRPEGEVIFASPSVSRAMKRARRQIVQLNQRTLREGSKQ